MAQFDATSSDDYDDYNESDEELQEAFAKGLLLPGLNIDVTNVKPKINNVVRLEEKLEEISQNLPWIERLDMINEMAPLAPELAVQLEKHEQKRKNSFAGNAKIKAYPSEEDPILNDFRREMMFHRQSQTAVIDGIKRLHELGIKTKRPDDYFAEMAKSDEHMQKIRKNLLAKQEGQTKSERIRQIREQRKIGKEIQKQARVQRVFDKKEMIDKLKKFRKGKLKNLDFLEDQNQKKNKSQTNRRQGKNARFGFGGKKSGMKRNTKKSSMGINDKKNNKKSFGGNKNNKKKSQRVGKSKRNQIKSKGKR